MRSACTLIFVFLFFRTIAQNYSGPESVEYDFANSRWLIANTQSHQVLARDMSGILTVFTTLTGTGPYGIEIVGDTLFCCNGGSIKGFLLSNASQVFNLNVGASFLNGITHDNSENLIVTDFSGKSIIKVNITTQNFSAIASSMTTTPNGIIFDSLNNRCVFVNWGTAAPIKAIDLTTNVISVLANTSLGNCDGIAMDGHGNYFVSFWSGQGIAKYDSTFTSSQTIITGLSSPADIYYNKITDTLAVPNAGNNTVNFYGFNTVGIDKVENNTNIFPALTNRFIHLESETLFNKYTIINTSGNVILSGGFLKTDCKQLDVESIPSGSYFIILSSGDNRIVKRFIKID